MAKNKQNYNVFFNTHTVSGIVISVGLFVCFLAGAFALFQTNINKWEANAKNGENITVDYEKVLSVIEGKGFTMTGRTFFMQMIDNPIPTIMIVSRPLRGKKLGKVKKAERTTSDVKVVPNGVISIKIDPKTYKIIDWEGAEPTQHLGTFLYHLHYFDQIPKIGLYLSGLVSLFFLFAIITGTIVHWKKIMSNFFTFRLKASLKNFWTDAHVALGIIGLPFQFMYAVTGALLGLVILVLLPSTMVLFDGDQGKLLGHIAPAYTSFDKTNELLIERPNINHLVQNAHEELHIDKPQITSINLTNYNDKNAHLMVEFKAENNNAFYDDTHITYRLRDEAIVEKKLIENTSYTGGSVLHAVRKLHFGQFGGNLVKALFFFLSLITCFVILSGVMVWLEARNSKQYEKKKKFNTNVGVIYLGASMGLFPAIAFFFCITKIFPLEMENRFQVMSNCFFIFWLCFIIYGIVSKDLYKINRYALILTGIMGIAIPFLNGFQSGLWFWKSLQSNYLDSFFIDVSWFSLGLIALISGLSVNRLISHKERRRLENVDKN